MIIITKTKIESWGSGRLCLNSLRSEDRSLSEATAPYTINDKLHTTTDLYRG